MSTKAQQIKEDAELAEGWASTTVADCFFDIRNGTTTTQNKDGEGIPVSRIETIQNACFDLSRIGHIKGAAADLIESFRYQPGDIALSHINSYEHVGKTALYEGNPNPFLHGMNLLRLRLGHKHLLPEFAYLSMQTNAFREDVRQRVAHAVNQVSINQKNLGVTPLIIAPAAEQARIVTTLRSILPSFQPILKRLERTRALLRTFRQAVLAAACSGKLTEDWREEHPDVESGATLVDKVLHERKLSKPPLAMRDCGDLDIPGLWAWTSFDTLIENGPQNGLYRPQSDYGDGSPIIRIEDYQNEFVRSREQLSKVKASKDEVTKYAVHPNDIVINRVNSPSHIGKLLLVPSSLCPAIFESNMMRITVTRSVSPSWVVTFLRSAAGKSLLTADAKWAVNQVSINQTDVVSTPIPIPPAEEQKEIVRRVEALFKLADVIDKRVAAATLRTEKLTHAILAKAFRGELVPTEAELARREGREYEPASVLLERIKAERAKATDGATKRKPGVKRKKAASGR